MTGPARTPKTQMSNQHSSAGARFRAALGPQQPGQVVAAERAAPVADEVGEQSSRLLRLEAADLMVFLPDFEASQEAYPELAHVVVSDLT